MNDLRELYQEVILDHNRNPRNFRELAGPEVHRAEGFNPLCGDKVDVYLEINGGRIADAAFKGKGCAISTASASMMTDVLKGKPVSEAERLFETFHRMLTGGTADPSTLGKLAVFAHVNEFPVRVKCATLAWHTLKAALEDRRDAVSTE